MRIPEEQHFHHDRPEWAVVTAEEFRRAQAQMEERGQKYQACKGQSAHTRYSAKHPLSTLIQCEHCGKSFCRRTYTYVHTRVYWTCSTSSQSAAGRCGSLVKLEEDELLAEISTYLESLIQDKERFVREVLAEVEKRRSSVGEKAEAEDVEGKRKRLTAKRLRYQEMYVNDMMTMAELREKTAQIAEELAGLDERVKQLDRPAGQTNNEREARYVREIERFLKLETASNPDLRRLIDHIGVSREGAVKIVFKKLEDGEELQNLPSWWQR